MLPKIKHVTFKVTLPSSGEAIVLRPFTVKEEKLLVTAATGNDKNDAIDAVRQLITNCVVDPEVFDVDSLSTFDFDYIFIQLRAKTVGESVNVEQTDEDGTVYQGTLTLSDVKVVYPEGHNNKFLVDEDGGIGVVMRYPRFSDVNVLAANEDDKSYLDAIYSCIDKIYDVDNVYKKGDDFNDDELVNFVDTIPSNGFKKITEFFTTMPYVSATVKLTKVKGKATKEFELRSLSDFFI